MIKSIEFINYRNLANQKYIFSKPLNIIFGPNNSGKTNILDGIRLAFSAIDDNYVRVRKSDFQNSDDTKPIEINVELDCNSIPSLNYYDENGQDKCGFKVKIRKIKNDRYVKEIYHPNSTTVDHDTLKNDPKIPNIFMIPLIRIEDLYTQGLTTDISKFIESEQNYVNLKNESKNAIKQELKDKLSEFQNLCADFNQNFDIELSEPKISDEKVYIVDGEKEHNYKIGSGYKSVANIFLNTLNENYNIVLVDEIENHLHPPLIRKLLRKLREIPSTVIIGTTHSPIVINELRMEELLYFDGQRFDSLDNENKKKLNTFLHPGRAELLFSDNIILVEGYTEELILKNYLHQYNYNWSIINVAGVMFEPYIRLGELLGKHILAISDNDISNSDNRQPSARFNKLKRICTETSTRLLEMDNTLETDLFNSGYLQGCENLLKKHEKHGDIYIAKDHKKIEIAEKIIASDVDLSEWHIISEIKNEFGNN